MIPALFLAALTQDMGGSSPLPAVQAPTVAPAQMTVAPNYAEPTRLALTPLIDGKLENEEWDPLISQAGMDAFFQWAPHEAFLAAKLPVGQDALFSLDMRGDGWFVGEDNLEIRVKWNGSASEFTVRRMVNSPQQGPTWVDASDYRASMRVMATGDSASWQCEIAVEDPGLGMLSEEPGGRYGVRVDAVGFNDLPMEAFLPRIVPILTGAMERGRDLPAGLRWKTEFRGRSVIPGDNIRIRLGFDGSEGLVMKRLEMRSEGLAQNHTLGQSKPFPNFDRKFRAIADYDTKVASEAPLGWRILRATVIDAQDKPTVLQTSYEIAAPVSFDWIPTNVAPSEGAQDVRIAVYIRSNTRRRVDGIFRVKAPEGWKIKSGNEKNFTLALPRGRKRQVFELEVPGGFKGAAPLKLSAVIGPYTAERTVWVTAR